MLTNRDKARARLAVVDSPTRTPLRPTRRANLVEHSLGQLPAVSIVTAVGLALASASDYAGRLQVAWAEPLLWLGMFVLVAGPVLRLVSPDTGRTERIGQILLLSVALYLVKVAYSPNAFTLPDELSHAYNVTEALRTGHLFHPNAVIAVTPFYPGLTSVTTALASSTGLSELLSGLLVIGAARIVLMLALFLLVERVTRSARAAGLAAALYTANPNFLFYSAEFGYEPLALALSAVVLFIVMRRVDAPNNDRAGWTVLAVVVALAVAVTHHLTAYALVAALWVTVAVSLISRRRALPAPWDIALLTTAVVGAWFSLVAGPTLTYLSPFLGFAAQGFLRLATFQAAPRQLFQTGQGYAIATPLWQQVLSFGSIFLILFGLPYGVLQGWRLRHSSMALMLGLAGLAFLPIQLLRLTPASWETANRSSEFLFAGTAFLIGLALLAPRMPAAANLSPRVVRSALSAYVIFIFLGGVVTSWRPDIRLPRAYLTMAAGYVVPPQGVAVADWTLRFLGPDQSIAADDSNAMLLMSHGLQYPWSGDASAVRRMLLLPTMDSSVPAILSGVRAHYLVVDRRLQSYDHLVGIYPLVEPAQTSDLLDPAIYTKFDSLSNVSRVADSGDIVVYNVQQLSEAGAAPPGG